MLHTSVIHITQHYISLVCCYAKGHWLNWQFPMTILLHHQLQVSPFRIRQLPVSLCLFIRSFYRPYPQTTLVSSLFPQSSHSLKMAASKPTTKQAQPSGIEPEFPVWNRFEASPACCPS